MTARHYFHQRYAHPRERRPLQESRAWDWFEPQPKRRRGWGGAAFVVACFAVVAAVGAAVSVLLQAAR